MSVWRWDVSQLLRPLYGQMVQRVLSSHLTVKEILDEEHAQKM